jgi:hypothetical protein
MRRYSKFIFPSLAQVFPLAGSLDDKLIYRFVTGFASTDQYRCTSAHVVICLTIDLPGIIQKRLNLPQKK